MKVVICSKIQYGTALFATCVGHTVRASSRLVESNTMKHY